MKGTNTGVKGSGQAAAPKIAVYRFKRLSPATGERFTSEMYATREAIERFEAAEVSGTAIEVEQADLDKYGRYHPLYTARKIHL